MAPIAVTLAILAVILTSFGSHEGCLHPILSPVSSSSLLQMFSDISRMVGVFPEMKDSETRLLVVNEAFDQCMGLKMEPGEVDSKPKSTIGQVLIRKFCDVNSGFRLGHAGSGFVNFGSYQNLDFACIGAGIFQGSLVHTGDWCDSPSHQFAMVVQGDTVKFVNRETSLCLSSSADDALIVDHCKDEDFYQKWRLCESRGEKCWPSNRPINIKTASMEENKL